MRYGAVRAAAESAGADADAAAAQIGGIARNLSVLEERFDYHLRNGGGRIDAADAEMRWEPPSRPDTTW